MRGLECFQECTTSMLNRCAGPFPFKSSHWWSRLFSTDGQVVLLDKYLHNFVVHDVPGHKDRGEHQQANAVP